MAELSEAFIMFNNTFEKPKSYYVLLPHIYKKLILSNFTYSSNNKDTKTIIINLCSEPLKSNVNKHIYNFVLDDSEHVSYEYFRKIMIDCCQLLQIAEKNNSPIIVNCYAGVNRSVSVIVFYSLLIKKYKVNQTINYIKKMKMVKYGSTWPTLTNNKFIDYLLKIQNELIH